MMKPCRKCCIEKELTLFSRCAANKDGLHFWCKECDAAGRKARRLANPERDQATVKAWHDAHPGRRELTDKLRHERNRDADLERSRAYYQANREDMRKANRKWRAENPQRITNANRALRERDGDRIRSKRREHYRQNKSRYVAQARRREIEQLRATPVWADLEAIAAFYAEADRLTLETGVKHHVDHIYPLRGKTSCGLHVPGNLQVLPALDNLKKSNKAPSQPMNISQMVGV